MEGVEEGKGEGRWWAGQGCVERLRRQWHQVFVRLMSGKVYVGNVGGSCTHVSGGWCTYLSMPGYKHILVICTIVYTIICSCKANITFYMISLQAKLCPLVFFIFMFLFSEVRWSVLMVWRHTRKLLGEVEREKVRRGGEGGQERWDWRPPPRPGRPSPLMLPTLHTVPQLVTGLLATSRPPHDAPHNTPGIMEVSKPFVINP